MNNVDLFDMLGDKVEHVALPETYQKLWDEINLPIQLKKANQNTPVFHPQSKWTVGSVEQLVDRDTTLNKLSKRAYYLTQIAQKFNVKNIVEVGTAEGWQFYSFAEYCAQNNGHVWSCDIEDKHSKSHAKEYKDTATFIHGDSAKLSDHIENLGIEIDLFYIDGSHEEGAVLQDVKNLKKLQSSEKMPIWIFDDYDERFGCYQDIHKIAKAANQYMVYSPGKTASNSPTHQLVLYGRFM
mgnify:FL=1|tara:strand:+ start:46890 stop:47606 length:717 start_codon:yes stop_codon:yes gene_type:complete